MRERRSLSAVLLVALCCARVAAAQEWPAWERFAALYVSEDGRVIDRSVLEHITTSEGQSYALFFALVANDRDAFVKLLRWTENNLAAGDLAARLPAWKWGRAFDGTWRVLDANSASDADLWLAYTLGEAARLWCVPEYATLGKRLAARILREEVAYVPGLGPTLLPGPKGFVEHNTWRLNASYVPIQLLRGLATQTRDAAWKRLISSSERVILASAPRGFAADWIEYRAPEGFATDRTTQGIGSYNAIRVYLWAGMLAPNDPMRAKLVRHFEPMIASTAARAAPVERVDTNTLETAGEGSPGFSAAMLPLLAASKRDDALAAHRARVEREALQDGESYYSDVLSLFGSGWIENRYRFERNGTLASRWTATCRAAR